LIVIDASVVVHWLVHLPAEGIGALHRLLRRGDRLAAPFLIDAEVGHAIRRQVLAGDISSRRAREALEDYVLTPVQRFPHTPFLQRAFELRDNATFYDALYIALAEVLRAPLLTFDAPLARTPGVHTSIEVLGWP
jgi:predicted nucleic acid-binding protein